MALCTAQCIQSAAQPPPPRSAASGGGAARQRQRQRQQAAACFTASSSSPHVNVTGIPRSSSRQRLAACRAAGPSSGGSSSDELEPDADLQRAFQLAAQRSAALEDYRLLMQVSGCW